MKITSFAVARPSYYDRRATSINKAYGSTSIAPHANTTRFSYTVPAGRKMFIENATVASFRDAAATVAGQQLLNLVLYDGVTYCNLLVQYYFTTTLYATQNQLIGNSATLYAGEQLIAATWDFCTGGSQDLRLSVKGTEYDA